MITPVENNAVTSTYETNSTQKKTKISGRTIGEPKLSEKAAKYYEELKKKYSNMDFILVSKDQKEQAQAQAGNYANANRMVVLIDEDKIEKMAEDKDYQKQYEGIIEKAGLQMPKLQSSLGAAASNVKTFGIQVNEDGTASFFAVLKKTNSAQKKRIAQKAAEKQKAKKQEEKKAAKREQEERLTAGKRPDAGKAEDIHNNPLRNKEEEETVTITASSVDALLQKVSDYNYANLSDQVQTAQEQNIGQHIDFRM